MQANSGAIVKLDETGNLMISEGHFASETIRVSRAGAGRLGKVEHAYVAVPIADR